MGGAVVAILAAACQPPTTSTASNGGAGAEITAQVTEFQFTPDSWEVPAGAEVMLTLDNQGTVEHTFLVIADGGRVSSAGDVGQATPEAQAQAGSRAEATFTAPSQPGSYQVICTIPGHLESGMEAILTVTEP